jgi:hypothetical protein
LLRFEFLKELYEGDEELGEIYLAYKKGAFNNFYKHVGFLFREKRLCIPKGSIRELLVKEAHGGNLMGPFRMTETLSILQEHFYWSKMRREVERHYCLCFTCRKTKSKTLPQGLYIPLPNPSAPWLDISINFILGCLDQREERTLYLWSFTGFPKWLIS